MQIARDETHAAGKGQIREAFRITAGRDHRVAGSKRLLDHMRSDESGRTGHQKRTVAHVHHTARTAPRPTFGTDFLLRSVAAKDMGSCKIKRCAQNPV